MLEDTLTRLNHEIEDQDQMLSLSEQELAEADARVAREERGRAERARLDAERAKRGAIAS